MKEQYYKLELITTATLPAIKILVFLGYIFFFKCAILDNV